jgi:NTE family protein
MKARLISGLAAVRAHVRPLYAARRVYAVLVSMAVSTACTEQAAVLPQAGEEPGFTAPQGRPQLALVLSGGGLRGFAHVGVLKALEAHGIRPDLVVGSSVGAVVGAVYASGRDARELERIVSANDFCLGSGWFRRSAEGAHLGLHAFVSSQVRHQRIEHFPIGFAAVATDLQDGGMAIFNHGGAALAAQASAGLPGAFASTMIRGRAFADGGLTSPVPVRAARALGAQLVIAVDLTCPPEQSRLAGLVDRMFQVGLVMVRSLAIQEAREADVLIEPILAPQDQIHLDNRAALIAAGEAATLAALPRIRELLAAKGQPSSKPAPLPNGRLDCGSATRNALVLSPQLRH